MIVFVEGVDGSGKTTLIEQLVARGAKRVDPVPRNDPHPYASWCKLFAKCRDEVYICDRGYITDAVYRLCDGNKPMLGMGQILSLLSDSKFVYCAIKDSFKQSMQRGEDNITDIRTHNELKQIYKYVMRAIHMFTNTDILVYNWHTNSLQEVESFMNNK